MSVQYNDGFSLISSLLALVVYMFNKAGPVGALALVGVWRVLLRGWFVYVLIFLEIFAHDFDAF